MSWNNPVATTGSMSTVRTNKLWCSSCGKKLSKGEKGFFVLDDKGRFMRVVHPRCMNHEEDELFDEDDNLHPMNVEDGMVG